LIAWILRGWSYKILTWVPDLHLCKDQDCYGTLAVFRISFCLALFHLILAIATIGVKKYSDCRVNLQDGWWAVKLLLLVGGIIGSFFIPNSFFQVYGWIALFASGLFILVQLTILVDFAHSWAENWKGKYEEDEDKRWFAALLTASLVMFTIALAGTIVMFVFFSKCDLNIGFIVMNIVLCIIVSALSIHPRIQEANPASGILQASVISAYATYLVWSSIMSEPASQTQDGKQCNPWSNNNNAAAGVTVIVGAIFTIVSVVYTTVRVALTFGKQDIETPESSPLMDDTDDKETINQTKEESVDPDEPVPYSFTKFHVIFALGAMYIGMLLSDWQTVWHGEKEANSVNKILVDSGMVAVWVKIVSSWLAVGLYCWTLVGPVLFPDRDWK